MATIVSRGRWVNSDNPVCDITFQYLLYLYPWHQIYLGPSPFFHTLTNLKKRYNEHPLNYFKQNEKQSNPKSIAHLMDEYMMQIAPAAKFF